MSESNRAQPFSLGCNYWASHAGIGMWSDWQPQVIDQDFAHLAANGLRTVRLFPLWPDFQPLRFDYTAMGKVYEVQPPESTGDFILQRARVSVDALEKFREVADLATRHGLELIVGLVTGWMSGRLFVPPALEGRNLHTDPVALMWQVRFVEVFVSYFKDHPAVVAWNLGNECNCLADPGSREAAWNWTAQIAHAIRAADPSRPIISGMHSLSANRHGHWSIEDQAELTDVLTVHPYPAFTPHCDRDRLNGIRSGLHATAEGCLYSDIGGKPCFAEEVGTLGPMLSSEKIAADYLRGALFSLWAHGNQGLLWWCGFDLNHLTCAPYEWLAMERELGLFRKDYAPKPVVGEYAAFAKFLESAPVLSPRRRRAVCILSYEEEDWGVAYAAFILAKQAGFEIEFQTTRQPLRDADLYLLPSLSGFTAVPRSFDLELWRRVESGASLYVSLNNGFLGGVREGFGLEIETRSQRAGPAEITWEGETFRIASPYRLDFRSAGSTTLAAENDGNPAFVRFARGKGQVHFLSVPIELEAVKNPGGFEGQPFWKFYREIGAGVISSNVLQGHDPRVGVTEHADGNDALQAVLINYSNQPVDFAPKLAPGWKVRQVTRGQMASDVVRVAPQDAVILTLER